LQRIKAHLNAATQDKKLLRSIEAEEEYQRNMDSIEKQVEEERRQKEEAQAKGKEQSIKLAKKMVAYGEPIDEIMAETGLSREEIEQL